MDDTARAYHLSATIRAESACKRVPSGLVTLHQKQKKSGSKNCFFRKKVISIKKIVFFVMDTVIFSFLAAGDYGQELFGKDFDSDIVRQLVCIDKIQKSKNDIVIGITPGDKAMKLVVLRSPSKDGSSDSSDELDELVPDSIDTGIVFYALGQYDTVPGKTYEIRLKDVEGMEEDDISELQKSTIGMLEMDSRTLIVHQIDHINLLITGESDVMPRLKPAFEPMYFGSQENELKDPRAATELWLATLKMSNLRKSTSGRVHYERWIDGAWKCCRSYQDVLDAAKDETGRDIYHDMRNHPDWFPSIQAEGTKAFINRRKRSLK